MTIEITNKSTKDEMMLAITELKQEIDLFEQNAEFNTSLPGAFNVIAGAMYDPAMRYNRDIDEMVEVNTLAFVQENILASFCYAIDKKIEWFEDKLKAEIEKVNRVRQQVINDEIGLQQLERAIFFVENRQLELATLRDLFNHAAEAHRHHTGKEWKPFTQAKTPQSKDTTAAELERRMAAMGIKGGVLTPNTNGIEDDATAA